MPDAGSVWWLKQGEKGEKKEKTVNSHGSFGQKNGILYDISKIVRSIAFLKTAENGFFYQRDLGWWTCECSFGKQDTNFK